MISILKSYFKDVNQLGHRYPNTFRDKMIVMNPNPDHDGKHLNQCSAPLTGSMAQGIMSESFGYSCGSSARRG